MDPAIKKAKTTLDMNGDGVRDSVFLLGRPGPDGSSMWKDVRLAMVDGAAGALTVYAAGDANTGYAPHLWIGFLGDATHKDVLVRIESGGSGGTWYYSLFTLKDGLPAPVVDPYALTAGISQEASVRFLPGFLVEVRMPSAHVQWVLDVSDRSAEYTALGFYDEQGRLLTSREGWVDPLVS
ncbi:hypothetical protein [Kyrpidia sp.]|uniref:hypothetical protein n=1 Tax=Kyrpidia sp. TaxID=2073077 RepID=UPI002584A650|nr:hypothetical protein [Kyrpidia sp.]MCL6577228.1 hypothetical protein [Kyrpidia sp.]